MAHAAPAIFHLTSQKADILNLQYAVNSHIGARNEGKWIGALGFRGSVIVFDREQVLRMNYVADDKKSILVQLNDQSALFEILADMENKIKAANAPHQAISNDLISYPDQDSGYMSSLKLKTEYTKFVDENGNAISNAMALSERRSILSFVLTVNKLNFFRGKWYFACILKSSKVSMAPPPAAAGGGAGRDVDYTQYL
jgi:hypothetical protein